MLLNAKLVYFQSAFTRTAGFAAFAKQTKAALNPSTQLQSVYKKRIKDLTMKSETSKLLQLVFFELCSL